MDKQLLLIYYPAISTNIGFQSKHNLIVINFRENNNNANATNLSSQKSEKLTSLKSRAVLARQIFRHCMNFFIPSTICVISNFLLI